MSIDLPRSTTEFTPNRENTINTMLGYLSDVSLKAIDLTHGNLRQHITKLVLETTDSTHTLRKFLGLSNYESHWEATGATEGLAGPFGINGNFTRDYTFKPETLWYNGASVPQDYEKVKKNFKSHELIGLDLTIQPQRYFIEKSQQLSDKEAPIQPLIRDLIDKSLGQFGDNHYYGIDFDKNNNPSFGKKRKYNATKNFVRLVVPNAGSQEFSFVDLTKDQYDKLTGSFPSDPYALTKLLLEPTDTEFQVLNKIGVKMAHLDSWYDAKQRPLITVGIVHSGNESNHPLHNISDSTIAINSVLSVGDKRNSSGTKYHPTSLHTEFAHSPVAGKSGVEYLDSAICHVSEVSEISGVNTAGQDDLPPNVYSIPIEDQQSIQYASKLKLQQKKLIQSTFSYEGTRKLAELMNIYEIRIDNIKIPQELESLFDDIYNLHQYMQSQNLFPEIFNSETKPSTIKQYLLGSLFTSKLAPFTPVSPNGAKTDEIEMTTPGNLLLPAVEDLYGLVNRFFSEYGVLDNEILSKFASEISKVYSSSPNYNDPRTALALSTFHDAKFRQEIKRAKIHHTGVASSLAFAANYFRNALQRGLAPKTLPPHTVNLSGSAQNSRIDKPSIAIKDRCSAISFTSARSASVIVSEGQDGETKTVRSGFDDPITMLKIIDSIQDPTFFSALEGYMNPSLAKYDPNTYRSILSWIRKHANGEQDRPLLLSSHLSGSSIDSLIKQSGQDAVAKMELMEFANIVTASAYELIYDDSGRMNGSNYLAEIQSVAKILVEKEAQERLVVTAAVSWAQYIEYLSLSLIKLQDEKDPLKRLGYIGASVSAHNISFDSIENTLSTANTMIENGQLTHDEAIARILKHQSTARSSIFKYLDKSLGSGGSLDIFDQEIRKKRTGSAGPIKRA